METFEQRLENILNQAIEKLVQLIENNGVESKYYSEDCLKIKQDEFMFNLEGGRYLTEIKRSSHIVKLVDNSGYSYSPHSLETDQFMQVVDHLITEYSN